MGRQLGCDARELPVTDWVWQRLVRLPFFYELRDDQMARVASELDAFLRGRGVRMREAPPGTDS
jgi:dTDP-4-amino-4,6-dideoxygalactose transaminase